MHIITLHRCTACHKSRPPGVSMPKVLRSSCAFINHCSSLQPATTSVSIKVGHSMKWSYHTHTLCICGVFVCVCADSEVIDSTIELTNPYHPVGWLSYHLSPQIPWGPNPLSRADSETGPWPVAGLHAMQDDTANNNPSITILTLVGNSQPKWWFLVIHPTSAGYMIDYPTGWLPVSVTSDPLVVPTLVALEIRSPKPRWITMELGMAGRPGHPPGGWFHG